MYHSLANNAKISIAEKSKKIYILITDDGRGFTMEKGTQTDGLTCIRERVASINGQLAIESEPGKGTRICVTIDKQ